MRYGRSLDTTNYDMLPESNDYVLVKAYFLDRNLDPDSEELPMYLAKDVDAKLEMLEFRFEEQLKVLRQRIEDLEYLT